MKLQLTALAGALIVTTTVALADTLVFVDGRRVQGELIGVVGSEIEFEERSGSVRRTMRVPRYEIARIEFEGNARTGNAPPQQGPPPIPRGLRERQVNVFARQGWNDAGLDVRAGQMLYFTARGEVRWGPNRRHGAAGERNSPVNPGRPMPDRPAAALIARVGEDGDPFFVGADQGPFRAPASGRLFLGINDDFLDDNSGNLRVTVSY